MDPQPGGEDSSEKYEGIPYRDLHIAVLKGVVQEKDEELLGSAFMGRWPEDDTTFLFFSEQSRTALGELLRRRPHLELMEEHRFSFEEWHGGRLEPTRVERFLITPAWEKPITEEDTVSIIMDPGVVFGTGLHPTTRDCLRALLALWARSPFETVVDLGTGTGVLAVASALLGAKRVLAVDLNPLCVKTARRNVRLNHLEDRVQVVEGAAEDWAGQKADCVIGNLHYEVLKGLVKGEFLRGTPWFIFSGLLRSQARLFKAHLQGLGLHLLSQWNHEDTWYTLMVQNMMPHTLPPSPGK
ncbi:MAG: methyltransferase domain-containing protein [Deltaproteobacteria bacterium]|nr:methyltransferase domain-containing protein [Deltaproteobacteria bacterium]